MDTKPFNLQSPESIAKEYGGNKQKIAQAMQMGILDPTAGTLAGMFIDRMRSAQMQEQAPQQTVAQQVFNPQPPAPPPPPPGGAPPPGMGAPPMGAPPPGGLGATAPAMQAGMAPPPAAPPPGMAMGGIASLPIPDQMFDEPDNGGYAGGGLVAFAKAGEVKEPSKGKDPDQLYGFFRDPVKGMEQARQAMPMETTYSDMLKTRLLEERDPAKMEAERKRNLWEAVMMGGLKMAQTPGTILQAATAGLGAAAPVLKEGREKREKTARDALLNLAQMENMTNEQTRQLFAIGMEGAKTYATLREQGLNREQALRIAVMQEAGAERRSIRSESGANARAALAANSGAERYIRDIRANLKVADQKAREYYNSNEGNRALIAFARSRGIKAKDQNQLEGLRTQLINNRVRDEITASYGADGLAVYESNLAASKQSPAAPSVAPSSKPVGRGPKPPPGFVPAG